MKKTLFIIFALLFSCEYVTSQTVYHYKGVAKVDANSGVKESWYGDKIHIIFKNSQACLCDEFGQIHNEDEQKYLEKNLGAGVKSIEQISGYQYHLDYRKSENGMSIYHSLYSKKTTTQSSGMYYMPGYGYAIETKIEKFLYVASDKSRVNYMEDNSTFGGKGVIKVYELYDTDEAGQARQSKFDPNSPAHMY